jgi:hypothetical protein
MSLIPFNILHRTVANPRLNRNNLEDLGLDLDPDLDLVLGAHSLDPLALHLGDLDHFLGGLLLFRSLYLTHTMHILVPLMILIVHITFIKMNRFLN